MRACSIAVRILCILAATPSFVSACREASDSCKEILEASLDVSTKVVGAWIGYLKQPEVQEILHLTSEQMKACVALVTMPVIELQADSPTIERDVLEAIRVRVGKEFERIDKILDDKQLEILHRIELQRSVPYGLDALFLRPDVSHRLELTSVQRQSIEKLAHQHEAELDAMRRRLRQRKATGRDRHNMLQEHGQELMRVLTQEQRDCWARVILVSYPAGVTSFDTGPER